jgi:hypothetical protein
LRLPNAGGSAPCCKAGILIFLAKTLRGSMGRRGYFILCCGSLLWMNFYRNSVIIIITIGYADDTAI